MIIIDFYSVSKVYELWDVAKDCKHTNKEFKSFKAAENFCKRNDLTYKIGLECDI
jgi:hypothetical protein